MQKATLNSIAGGRVEEVFQRELSKVLDNLADERTSPTKKREITLKLTFEFDDTRRESTVRVDGKSTLAPFKPLKGFLFAAKDEEGNLAASVTVPKQLSLADQLEEAQAKAKGE